MNRITVNGVRVVPKFFIRGKHWYVRILNQEFQVCFAYHPVHEVLAYLASCWCHMNIPPPDGYRFEIIGERRVLRRAA